MAHVTFVEDGNGDVINAHYFCSDLCAQQHNTYAGWYGCVKLSYDAACVTCQTSIVGDVETRPV